MKIKMIIAATALACAALFGSTLAAAAAADVSRGDLTRAVVQKWSGHVDKTFPVGADAWSVEMAPAFAQATMEELQAAAGAKSFDEMNSLLLGRAGGGGTQALGDAAADLVYVPVTPCRIFDTRLAGGPIAAGTTRDFDVTVIGSYAIQGGVANNCDGVGTAGSFAAALINFTTVGPTGAGFITAFPLLANRPLAATVNYTAGSIVGNAVAVQLDQGADFNELSVYSFAGTHVVGDIQGYFIAPEPTAIQCVEVESAAISIAGGASGSAFAPACPAGYGLAGGGCGSSSFSGRMVTSRTLAFTHLCAWSNEGVGAGNFTAFANCCRVPGR